ncbi:cytochrome-c peroxidase [Vibrio gigantis]|uniref:cytochrome c peroxidase n=1 Tax=Vibrio gigantis TaxID=296199 RepID=UPI003D0B91A1
MNNKKIILSLVGLGIAAYLGSVYLVGKNDQKLAEQNLAQFSSLDKSSLDYQAMKVLTDKGCSYCHTGDSEMPFYADWPIAKNLMDKDLQSGMRHFEITQLFNGVQGQEPISEVALARIEKVLYNDSMPPKIYQSMHWSAGISKEEKHTLLKWIRQTRADLHANSPVHDEGKKLALQPIYSSFDVNEDRAKLGKALYHDTRLSGDDTVSCASCHGLDTGGVDNLVGSVGIHGQVGGINAPTVFNSVYNKLQFWDGRANDLQDQAGGPPFNPIEMGSEGWDQIVDKLSNDQELVAMFDKTYEGEISGYTITHAIAEFEKTLTTPNSRFDQYLTGNVDAIDSHEKYGLMLFKKYSCGTCHAGEAMGGETFEAMGLKADYFSDRGSEITPEDMGRFNVTGNETDRHKFKVPTLRNIELTAPYFHDGQAETLDKAIFGMGKYQVGVEMSDDEVDAIKAFLKTLTGEYKGNNLSPKAQQQS